MQNPDSELYLAWVLNRRILPTPRLASICEPM